MLILHRPFLSPLLLMAASLVGLLAMSAAAHAQHVHGLARLGVAVDGGTLLIDLDAPLESLVGFEHAPRNARQREAMAVMQARLNQATALWRPNAEAACVAGSHEVDVHHDDGHADHGHADVTAHVSYRCAKPEALRHLDIDMWQAFPRLKTLSVSVALPRVQFTRRLERDAGRAGKQVQASRLSLVPKRSR